MRKVYLCKSIKNLAHLCYFYLIILCHYLLTEMIYISVKFLTNDIDKFFFSKFDDIIESYLVINNLINVVVESAMIANSFGL